MKMMTKFCVNLGSIVGAVTVKMSKWMIMVIMMTVKENRRKPKRAIMMRLVKVVMMTEVRIAAVLIVLIMRMN